MNCEHRKYGTYGTYSLLHSYWPIYFLGWRFSPSLFGCLKECDSCKKRFIRWPTWAPPIDETLIPR